ncbi:MAG: beta-hydroxyacyl-ACP dehydratase [Phycisphaerales bacterium]|nr:MAG: beta-hydroxyacyl-ACP dehydratase [Phycisphaerales bacterium]
MPPPLLFDLEGIDLDHICVTQEQIYEYLPHRHEFMLLHGICHLDIEKKHIIAFRDIRADDWWFPGHVPGRPLLPGVLMLEMAGQASGLLAKMLDETEAFIGFGGVDQCKFRETVEAYTRLYLLCRGVDIRHRRVVSDTQGVANGRLIFEARITGVRMR